MRTVRSRQVCLACSNTLPRAAIRCPWCVSSTSLVAADGHFRLPRRRPGNRNMNSQVLR